jgi:hypothetical protein
VGLDHNADCKKKCPKAQEQLNLFSKKLFGVCLKYSSIMSPRQPARWIYTYFDKIEQFTLKVL